MLHAAVESVLDGTAHDTDNDWAYYHQEYVRKAVYRAGLRGLDTKKTSDMATLRLAMTVFKGYFRISHNQEDRFGGLILVAPARVLLWFRFLVDAYLDVKGVAFAGASFSEFCSSGNTAVEWYKFRGAVVMLDGIPLPGGTLNAWDFSNLISHIPPRQIVLLTEHPTATWHVPATKTGINFRPLDHFLEFNLFEFTRNRSDTFKRNTR